MACHTRSLPQSPNEGEAESEVFCPASELKAVLDAWPAPLKAAILAMIRAAG
jgi:hypothetical protein